MGAGVLGGGLSGVLLGAGGVVGERSILVPHIKHPNGAHEYRCRWAANGLCTRVSEHYFYSQCRIVRGADGPNVVKYGYLLFDSTVVYRWPPSDICTWVITHHFYLRRGIVRESWWTNCCEVIPKNKMRGKQRGFTTYLSEDSLIMIVINPAIDIWWGIFQ